MPLRIRLKISTASKFGHVHVLPPALSAPFQEDDPAPSHVPMGTHESTSQAESQTARSFCRLTLAINRRQMPLPFHNPSLKSRLVLQSFWYRLTQVVLEKEADKRVFKNTSGLRPRTGVVRPVPRRRGQRLLRRRPTTESGTTTGATGTTTLTTKSTTTNMTLTTTSTSMRKSKTTNFQTTARMTSKNPAATSCPTVGDSRTNSGE